MGDIKVSVIIPVFNTEKYLNECIESVISQTLKEIEIICIDDGSTDFSPQILKEYASKDDRISIISQSNKGAGIARNEGIRRARGKYVMFMDADDYYPDDDVIESLYNAAERNNVYIAGGEFSHIRSDGYIEDSQEFEGNPLLYGYVYAKEDIIRFKDYQFDYGYHRFLYKRQFLIDNRLFFPNLTRFQDPPFFVRTLSKADYFCAIKKVVYRYRIKNIEVEWNAKKVADLVDGLIYVHDFALEHGYYRLQELIQRRMTTEYGHIIQDELNRHRNSEQAAVSISYKLGLFLTYIPRKVVHFFIMKDKSL